MDSELARLKYRRFFILNANLAAGIFELDKYTPVNHPLME